MATRLRAAVAVAAAAAMLWTMVPVAGSAPATNAPPARAAADGGPASAVEAGLSARQQAGDTIARPNRRYRRATCKMRFDQRRVGARFRQVRRCGNRVTISRRAQRSQVPTSWATWSSRPFAEDPEPAVAFLPRDNIRFTFARPVRIAGFEVEPNTRSTARVTIRFLDGRGRTLRLVRRNVDGDAGARLFALAVSRPRIKQMSVQVEDDAGFAVAQIRIAR